MLSTVPGKVTQGCLSRRPSNAARGRSLGAEPLAGEAASTEGAQSAGLGARSPGPVLSVPLASWLSRAGPFSLERGSLPGWTALAPACRKGLGVGALHTLWEQRERTQTGMLLLLIK